MTAPTINGTRYPQPIDALLTAARDLDLPDGQAYPSRNRLMREFRIGAPKADELLARLKTGAADPAADTTEPIASDPDPAPVVPESAPPVAGPATICVFSRNSDGITSIRSCATRQIVDGC